MTASLLIGVVAIFILSSMPMFLIGLLIEFKMLIAKDGRTRIFLATFLAMPIVGFIWGLLAWLAGSDKYQTTAFLACCVGYIGALIPVFVRWYIVRRRAKKLAVGVADIFS